MLALIACSKIGHRTERHIAAVRLAASYNCLLHCMSPQVADCVEKVENAASAKFAQKR
jgi:hypothetical protein